MSFFSRFELKNATTNDRAKVAATGTVAEGDVALAVQAPVLGVTSGAALTADAAATIQQYARSLFKEFLARIGATDGAAVITDAAGTLQQFLRGCVVLLLASRKAVAPTLAAPVSFAVSGADAGSGALAVGNYVLSTNISIWWRVNAAAGGTAASVGGAGCKLLAAGGETELIPVVANGEIRAITTGGGGFATSQLAT